MNLSRPGYFEWAAVTSYRPSGAPIPPPVFPGLYVCGSLEALQRTTVAIVGTRAASTAGKSLARNVARELARNGCCIISGLALGIDASAHRGALDCNAPTIGILGGGHERFFPARNRELAQQMLNCGGAVCSPFPPTHDARPGQFLARNGVVAALSDAVVVVEAPSRSGALNTATWAAGRIPVFVFPGDVDRANVAGCLQLLREGATLVRSATDILEDLRIAPLTLMQPSAHTPLEPTAAVVLQALQSEAQSLDALVASTGLPVTQALAALTRLELEGLVEQHEGGRYVAK